MQRFHQDTTPRQASGLYQNNDEIKSIIENKMNEENCRRCRRAYDQRGLGSKPIRTNLWCPWERHFTAYSSTWWSWQAVLNFNHISIKFQPDSNILVSPEAGRENCLPYV